MQDCRVSIDHDLEERSGQSNSLLLTSTQLQAALAHNCIIPADQARRDAAHIGARATSHAYMQAYTHKIACYLQYAGKVQRNSQLLQAKSTFQGVEQKDFRQGGVQASPSYPSGMARI